MAYRHAEMERRTSLRRRVDDHSQRTGREDERGGRGTTRVAVVDDGHDAAELTADIEEAVGMGGGSCVTAAVAAW